jgi:4-carboxymuconolactone decarboxylase
VTRLPYLHRDQLDDKGVAVWDSVVGSRGATVTNEEGGLVGPFNAWLHAPDVGARTAELGAMLRFGTSIERRLLELAIITVGAHWKAEFEWWAHSGMARHHGVPDEVIDAIAKGDQPTFESDDDRVVHEVARQLVTTGRLDTSAYDAAQRLLGDQGVVELVALCGYYTLVSFTLNAFTVPLPTGVEPTWG